MKQFIFLLVMVLIVLTISCEKSSPLLCGGTEPVKSLPWLKMEVERINASGYCHTISRATYNNQTVYIVATCDPAIDSIPQLYDCDGNVLNIPGDNYQDIKFTGPVELIWKTN